MQRQLKIKTAELVAYSSESLCRAFHLPPLRECVAFGDGLIYRIVLKPSFHAEVILDLYRVNGNWECALYSARLNLHAFVHFGVEPTSIHQYFRDWLLPPARWVSLLTIASDLMPEPFALSSQFLEYWAVKVNWLQIDGIGIDVFVVDGEYEYACMRPPATPLDQKTMSLIYQLLIVLKSSCNEQITSSVLDDLTRYFK